MASGAELAVAAAKIAPRHTEIGAQWHVGEYAHAKMRELRVRVASELTDFSLFMYSATTGQAEDQPAKLTVVRTPEIEVGPHGVGRIVSTVQMLSRTVLGTRDAELMQFNRRGLADIGSFADRLQVRVENVFEKSAIPWFAPMPISTDDLYLPHYLPYPGKHLADPATMGDLSYATVRADRMQRELTLLREDAANAELNPQLADILQRAEST